jgi:hypothetical protein
MIKNQNKFKSLFKIKYKMPSKTQNYDYFLVKVIMVFAGC